MAFAEVVIQGENCVEELPLQGVVSLLDMLKFKARHFCQASSLIGQLYAQTRSGVAPTSGSWGVIAGELGALEKECESLELPVTLAQIRRIKPIFLEGNSQVSPYDLAQMVAEAQIRLTDELESRLLFILNADEASHYNDHHFHPSVLAQFPEASFDIDEAAKCRALERSTACVFHLMRITEYGVQAMAKLVGISDARPNWEPVIAKIDKELKLPYQDRQFKGASDILANMSSHLHAVKVAWRNRAMHVEKTHTMEQAREIYGATSGLMRYLAENLPK